MKNKKPEQIEFFSLGNGISVCDTNREVSGDYKKVAHISKYREVQFLCKVSDEAKNKILCYAETANPRISATQDEPVFIEKTFKYIVNFNEKVKVCYAYNLEQAFTEAETFARKYNLPQDFTIEEKTGEFIENPPHFGIREPI
jgi:hypothetical protein